MRPFRLKTAGNSEIMAQNSLKLSNYGPEQLRHGPGEALPVWQGLMATWDNQRLTHVLPETRPF